MMEKGEGVGWIFMIFGATLLAQVFGILIDCTHSDCTPLTGTVTILLTTISVLTIIFGFDRITKY